jgi:sulfite exporter TauE/SafE
MNHAMAMSGSLTLFAAFIAGTAASVHCLAMCGGLSGALALRTRRAGASPADSIGHSLTYQAGRLSSYAIAGAIVGAAGATLDAFVHLERFAVAMRLLAGLVMIAMAVGILFKWRPLALIERFGGRVWSRIAPLARGVPATSFRGSLLLGMLWGWLPCGMVYSMLLIAALAGSGVMGAATMLCFGAGTVPAVLAAGWSSTQLLRRSAGRIHVVAGVLLLTFGLFTALAPLSLPMHAHS